MNDICRFTRGKRLQECSYSIVLPSLIEMYLWISGLERSYKTPWTTLLLRPVVTVRGSAGERFWAHKVVGELYRPHTDEF